MNKCPFCLSDNTEEKIDNIRKCNDCKGLYSRTKNDDGWAYLPVHWPDDNIEEEDEPYTILEFGYDWHTMDPKGKLLIDGKEIVDIFSYDKDNVIVFFKGGVLDFSLLPNDTVPHITMVPFDEDTESEEPC